MYGVKRSRYGVKGLRGLGHGMGLEGYEARGYGTRQPIGRALTCYSVAGLQSLLYRGGGAEPCEG